MERSENTLKNKRSFPTDDAVMKSVLLAINEATKNRLCQYETGEPV